jgi:ATP adenylyltransferase
VTTVPLYHLGNHRDPEQLARMRVLEEAGVCVFCPAALAVRDDRLRVSPHWTVVPNEFPYAGTRLHLLLIPAEHVADLVDLSDAARSDLWPMLAWAKQEYTLTFYGLGVRNGDPAYTGGTVEHLHLHLIVGDVGDPQHRPVRLKLSSRP